MALITGQEEAALREVRQTHAWAGLAHRELSSSNGFNNFFLGGRKMKRVFPICLGFLITVSAFAGSPHTVPIMTAVTVGTSSQLALAANQYRGYLIIQNQGTSTCLVSFGSPITGNHGLQIAANQNYEPVEAFVKSAVYMQCGSNSTIEFAETNY
jgi:hypothetical protein